MGWERDEEVWWRAEKEMRKIDEGLRKRWGRMTKYRERNEKE